MFRGIGSRSGDAATKAFVRAGGEVVGPDARRGPGAGAAAGGGAPKAGAGKQRRNPPMAGAGQAPEIERRLRHGYTPPPMARKMETLVEQGTCVREEECDDEGTCRAAFCAAGFCAVVTCDREGLCTATGVWGGEDDDTDKEDESDEEDDFLLSQPR